MNDTTTIVAGAALGAALGALYFGALWRSLQRLAGRRAGVVMLVTTTFVRLLSVALVLTLTVIWGGWQALLGALAGFMAVRIVLTRKVRSGLPANEIP
jgi:F1F0 ATPase subunit 2